MNNVQSMTPYMNGWLKQGAESLFDLGSDQFQQAINAAQFLTYYVKKHPDSGAFLASITASLLANSPELVADFEVCLADLKKEGAF